MGRVCARDGGASNNKQTAKTNKPVNRFCRDIIVQRPSVVSTWLLSQVFNNARF
jgi:hypothetical protein